MAQNTSSAVMQQRKEPHDSLDDFPTPPWAGRALCEHVLRPWLVAAHGTLTVLEPACNRGYLARGLGDYFKRVVVSDIFDYGIGAKRADYLFDQVHGAHFIITNPPFRLASQFIEKALRESEIGCAMLVRSAFLEGVDRYKTLFKIQPPTIVAQFTERVPMVKGRCDGKASSATAYCWLVWLHGEAPRPFQWIPPCRKQLERPGDYDLPVLI
jgi:hypothetical protein